MKTNYFSSAKSISIIGLICVIMVSCGTYKDSSYYDNDGIYGGSEVKKTERKSNSDSNENNQYKDYFGSLQKNDGEVEIFTDVESYNTNQDTEQEPTEASSYAGWGNNSGNVTVVVYDNNWAWNGWNSYVYGPNYYGWGWNSWYGPSYGWGWNSWYGPGYYYPYYGWGWNNYYNGYYGYGYNYHHHTYNHGIRGSSYRGDRAQHSVRRNDSGTRNNNYNIGRRNSVRSYNSTTTPRNISPTRNTTPRRTEATTTPRNYNQSSTPRNNTPRSENVTPRNNTPRSESYTPRSYTPSSNSNQNSGGGGRAPGGRR